MTKAKASVLAAATLVSPADGSKNLDIPTPVSWTGPPAATSYTVQIATKADFSDAQSGDAPSSPVRFSSLTPGTTYYWRVQAKNAQQSAAWSEQWSFTTKTNSTGVFEDENDAKLQLLPSPADQQVELRWRSEASGLSVCSIIDAGGRVVARRQMSSLAGLNREHIDCSALANGVYTIQLQCLTEILHCRMIVAH